MLWNQKVRQRRNTPLVLPHRKAHSISLVKFPQSQDAGAEETMLHFPWNNLLHYTPITNKQTECFLVQWNTGNFFQVLSCWLQYRLNSLWLCTAMNARQVSISKLGLCEETVLQFPGYYPLKSSIAARDFKKVFLPPRAFTEIKVRLCTNAKWSEFSARGHLRWLWQLEFPRGSTFCLSARGQGGAPVVLIPRTVQKTHY